VEVRNRKGRKTHSSGFQNENCCATPNSIANSEEN
jgi:hypothetical protein